MFYTQISHKIFLSGGMAEAGNPEPVDHPETTGAEEQPTLRAQPRL